jgi:hypothetical protein
LSTKLFREQFLRSSAVAEQVTLRSDRVRSQDIPWRADYAPALYNSFQKIGGALSPFLLALSANAETADERVALGNRVYGWFGAFIPLGIKIGLDAVERLNAARTDRRLL